MRHRWERCVSSQGGTQGCGVHGVIQKLPLRLRRTASRCFAPHAGLRFSASTRPRCIRKHGVRANCWSGGRSPTCSMWRREPLPSGRQWFRHPWFLRLSSLRLSSSPQWLLFRSLPTQRFPSTKRVLPLLPSPQPARSRLTLRRSPTTRRWADVIVPSAPSRNDRLPSRAQCGVSTLLTPSFNRSLLLPRRSRHVDRIFRRPWGTRLRSPHQWLLLRPSK